MLGHQLCDGQRVSAANVVATMEVPASQYGRLRPDKEFSTLRPRGGAETPIAALATGARRTIAQSNHVSAEAPARGSPVPCSCRCRFSPGRNGRWRINRTRDNVVRSVKRDVEQIATRIRTANQ